MSTALILVHLFIPLFLSVVYVYFLMLFNNTLYITILAMVVFIVLLFFYSLRTHVLLRYKPKMTKNIKELQILDDHEKILDYKKNEEHMKSVKQTIKQMRKSEIPPDIMHKYLQLYQQTSYCQYCKCTKPPRAYHCFQCKACVLRREKHSQLINQCVGEGNTKPFIQYMFISMVISGYMTTTLILATIFQSHHLNELSSFELMLFALEEMVLIATLLLSIKEFTISYINAKHNITETERKENILNMQNNPFTQMDFYHQIFTSRLQFLSVHNIADYSQWIDEQTEEN